MSHAEAFLIVARDALWFLVWLSPLALFWRAANPLPGRDGTEPAFYGFFFYLGNSILIYFWGKGWI